MRKVKVTAYNKNGELVEQGGWFHCWGSDFEEFESGPVSMTMGIIELEEGNRIVTVFPRFIKFISPPE